MSSQMIDGIDSGKNMIKYNEVNPHKVLLGRLKYFNKSLSKKVSNSNNNDYAEKVITKLANKHKHIVVETLNLSGMSKNHKIARLILNMEFYNFKNSLQTKIKIKNKQLNIANRWFANSKLCNNGNYHYREITLEDRIWFYFNYCTNHDRDINSAKNLEKLAVISIVLAYEVATDGGTFSNQSSTSYAMLKQEFDSSIVQDCNILYNFKGTA
jgi:transposase